MRSAVSRVPPLVPSWVSVPVSQQWLLPSPRKASNSAPRPLTSCLPKFTERALRHRAPAGAGAPHLSIEQQKARGDKKVTGSHPAKSQQGLASPPTPAPPRPARLPVPYLCLRSWWRAAPCALPAPAQGWSNHLDACPAPAAGLNPAAAGLGHGRREKGQAQGFSPSSVAVFVPAAGAHGDVCGSAETRSRGETPGAGPGGRCSCWDGVWVGDEERQKDEGTSWGGCGCAPGSCRVPTGWHQPFAEGAGGVSTAPDPCPGGRAGGTKGTQRGLSPQPGHCGVVQRMQRPPEGLAPSFT